MKHHQTNNRRLNCRSNEWRGELATAIPRLKADTKWQDNLTMQWLPCLLGPFLLRHFPLFSLIASMKLLQLGIHWNLPYVNAFGASTGAYQFCQRYQKLPAECPSGSGPTARWNAKVGWSGPGSAVGRPPIGCPVGYRRLGNCWGRGFKNMSLTQKLSTNSAKK